MTAPRPLAGGQAPRGSNPMKIVLGCVIGLLVLLILGALGTVLAWRAFVRFGVGSDLVEYQQMVNRSDLDETARQAYIRRLDQMRERARRAPIGMLEWLNRDEAIRGLIADGTLPPEEQERLTRELDGLERDLE